MSQATLPITADLAQRPKDSVQKVEASLRKAMRIAQSADDEEADGPPRSEIERQQARIARLALAQVELKKAQKRLKKSTEAEVAMLALLLNGTALFGGRS